MDAKDKVIEDLMELIDSYMLLLDKINADLSRKGSLKERYIKILMEITETKKVDSELISKIA